VNLLRCKPATHIFIAIPSYSSTLQFDTAMSLVDALPKLAQVGITVSMKCVEGNCYVDLARNELVKAFLETEATDMIFVDADVGFHVGTMLAICEANRPFVAAVYPKKDDVERYPVNLLPGKQIVDSEGFMEVAMAPTGMMRLNRVVFDALRPTVKEYNGRTGMQHAYFKCDIREAYYGEDIEFCRIWREAGGKIWVLPNETLSHTGPKSWIGNLGQAMRSGELKQ